MSEAEYTPEESESSPEQPKSAMAGRRTLILVVVGVVMVASVAAAGFMLLRNPAESVANGPNDLPQPAKQQETQAGTPMNMPTTALPTNKTFSGRNPFFNPVDNGSGGGPGGGSNPVATGTNTGGVGPSATSTPTGTSTPTPTSVPTIIIGPQGPAGRDGQNASLEITYIAWNPDESRAAIMVSTGHADKDKTYNAQIGQPLTTDINDVPAAWVKFLAINSSQTEVTIQLGDEMYTLAKGKPKKFF